MATVKFYLDMRRAKKYDKTVVYSSYKCTCE